MPEAWQMGGGELLAITTVGACVVPATVAVRVTDLAPPVERVSVNAAEDVEAPLAMERAVGPLGTTVPLPAADKAR